MTTPARVGDVSLTHERVSLVTGVTLHVVTAGPADGTPVVLLHGFPDTWIGWRHQIVGLVGAGYRVIVPEQRGYGTSDKPPRVRDYRFPTLVDDVAALIDAVCPGTPVHLVGHDWGGAVAWGVAARHASRVRTLTVMNCPRPELLRASAWTNPRQVLRSWYILAFQVPGLAERLLTPDKLVDLLRRATRGDVSDEDASVYRETFSQPGAVRGMVSWYRAAPTSATVEGRIRVPTLHVWGTGDEALGDELAELSMPQCDDGRLVRFELARHFVQVTARDAVNAELLTHLGEHGGADPHVYKIVPRAVWEAAPSAWAGSEHDARDGFVHLSSAAQVTGTRTRHFAGQTDLLCLTVDPARLPAGALRWEPSRDGKRFPHLYAPLTRHAVIATRPLD